MVPPWTNIRKPTTFKAPADITFQECKEIEKQCNLKFTS